MSRKNMCSQGPCLPRMEPLHLPITFCVMRTQQDLTLPPNSQRGQDQAEALRSPGHKPKVGLELGSYRRGVGTWAVCG